MSTYSTSLTAQDPQTHRVSAPGTPRLLSQPETPNHESSHTSTPSDRFSSPGEGSSISGRKIALLMLKKLLIVEDGLDIVPLRQRRFKSARLIGE